MTENAAPTTRASIEADLKHVRDQMDALMKQFQQAQTDIARAQAGIEQARGAEAAYLRVLDLIKE
jgi:multidrug resistance efflux pump